MLAIFFTLALVCVEFTVGNGVCRVRGVLTNEIKCGDKVYTRNQDFVDAVRKCTAGRQGEHINTEMILCTYSDIKAKEGSTDTLHDTIIRDIRRDFGAHAEPLVEAILSCCAEFKDDSVQSTKMQQCLYKKFERVCGTKSCNFLNNYIPNDE